jgi:trimethylamine--corrinoid protein Co-methyltransferase
VRPVELVTEEGLELIEHNADTILERVGVEIRDYPSAIERFRDAGCEVDGTRVRFPRGMARELVTSSAPSIYTQHARNPQRSVQIGGDATVFAPNYGSPFVHDLDDGRRYATLHDFENFVKLAYLSPHLHHSGGTVCEPVDVPVSKRHLDMVYAHLRYSDKPFMGSVTAGERAADSVEMARIAFGGDLSDRTVMTSLINASSPLVWDGTMLAAAEVYAEANQATIISPFILAGAMAPATSAAVITQTLAEAMVGMAFTQLVRPGAPVVFGSFASSMSMQTGAPTFGTPEPAMVLLTVGQLARRLGVPFRSGGSLCASKLPDAQAASESANTLWPTLLGGVNFVLHAAGWLEGGLAIGYEKFVLDIDQLGAVAVLAQGLDLSENALALDAMCEHAPGEHHLGTAHTLANFETAFYRSSTADNSSFEQWSEDGALDAAQRANKVWKDQLAAYEPPAVDDAIDEELREYVTRRKAELPDEFA